MINTAYSCFLIFHLQPVIFNSIGFDMLHARYFNIPFTDLLHAGWGQLQVEGTDQI